MSVADKTINCRDCGQQFVFSASEQAFFAERGFSDPVRCLACRRALKARKAEASGGEPPRPARPAGQEFGSAERSDRGSYAGPSTYPDRPSGGNGGSSRAPRYQSGGRSDYGEPQQDWDWDGSRSGSERRAGKPKRPPRWIEAEPEPDDAY